MLSEIYQYSPSQAADYIMLQWLERMRHDGELDKTISAGHQTPLTFLTFLTHKIVLYRLDSLGNLAMVCWFEPCMGSAFMGYYVQPNCRRIKDVLHFMYDCMDKAFDLGVPVIVCMFQDRETEKESEAFLYLLEKAGFMWCGEIPKFFDGKAATFVALTKEDWDEGNKPINNWRKRRSK